MRILLVMPTPFESGRLGLENVVWLSEPVALTTVGTAVSSDHDVQILDMRLEKEDVLVETLNTFRPDIVGTTSMTTDAYQAKAVLRTAKAILPGTLTIVGGHHPTLSPDEFDTDYIDCIVQGEGEATFREIVDLWETQRNTQDTTFEGVDGCRYKLDGEWQINAKRSQAADLDDLPLPDCSLIKKYSGRYFFTAARPVASIFTSRGCSFDCNFCAIWEFYERRTRYLSAKKIVDQMENIDEPYVFILDDNFLTKKKRLIELCEELESRGVKKYWMTQGRTDFVAQNPEIMARLAKNGLIGLLSGFESNDDDTLASLRKKSSYQMNLKANKILRENGVFTTGIFMVRADWTKAQFDNLYAYINEMEIGIPLVTILTPLPGTQLYKAWKDKLLTHDVRLFDLLHAVLPTRLSRADFYKEFSRSINATEPSVIKAVRNLWKVRPGFMLKALPSFAWFYARTRRYQRIHSDHTSFLRDEEGLLNGPGAKAGLTWEDIKYPTGDDDTVQEEQQQGELVTLKIPRRTWTDDVKDAQASAK